MKKEYLFTPGPTPVPFQALEVMGKPIFHHRTKQYRDMFKEVTGLMQQVFQTRNDVLTFTSSGSGAMEASVVNLLSPGDTVITINGGKFGERWTKICEAYGIITEEIMLEWGTSVDPEKIKDILSRKPYIKAVFTQLCETSTGVKMDIRSIAEIVKNYDALLVVDAVSGLGADDLKTDEWGVDVVVSGSQKGLMIPPGLSFVSMSQKAWHFSEKSQLPKFYFSFKKAKKSLETFDNPWTPALTLIRALQQTLSMMVSEGIGTVISRHARLAKAARAGVAALGLSLFAPQSPSNAVTAVKVPEGIDGALLVKKFKNEFGITVAGGQAQVKGKIFRIAHLGYFDDFDIVIVLSALERILIDLGYRIDPGTALANAQKVFLEEKDTKLQEANTR
ncbi:pyridoxal-phosphate-dependent aminotransferase family protein [Chlamydiota bacterium]